MPSGTARTEPRPPGTVHPGRNAVGGGVGGPTHPAVGLLFSLEGKGPFAARVTVLRQSTDGNSVANSFRVESWVGDGDLG